MTGQRASPTIQGVSGCVDKCNNFCFISSIQKIQNGHLATWIFRKMSIYKNV